MPDAFAPAYEQRFWPTSNGSYVVKLYSSGPFGSPPAPLLPKIISRSDLPSHSPAIEHPIDQPMLKPDTEVATAPSFVRSGHEPTSCMPERNPPLRRARLEPAVAADVGICD